MSNDNKKTKNNASCEEKQDMRQLTEEELEKVTGGTGNNGQNHEGTGGVYDPLEPENVHKEIGNM